MAVESQSNRIAVTTAAPYLASSNLAHTAGGGEVVRVEVGEGQFVNVKVTGRLTQTQQVEDGLDLGAVRHIGHRPTSRRQAKRCQPIGVLFHLQCVPCQVYEFNKDLVASNISSSSSSSSSSLTLPYTLPYGEDVLPPSAEASSGPNAHPSSSS